MPDLKKTIELFVDVNTKAAKEGFASVKQAVGEADGAFGKLRAGAGSTFDAIGAAGPAAIAGIGLGISAFVGKAIGDFENLAESAKSFSAVAGTSVEDASRWIEVASDLGVETDAVQAAMSRLNREADQGKLAKFGINASNANDRLIQTLQYLSSIPDEARRSQASFELLGKGAAAIAPLVANVDSLRSRLADVKGGKLISDEDVKTARELADSFDNIKDSAESFALQLAKGLAPTIQKLADLVNNVNAAAGGDEAGGGLLGWIGKAIDYTPGLDAINAGLGYFADSTDEANTATDGMSRTIFQATSRVENHTTAVAADTQQEKEAKKAADDAAKAIDALNKVRDAAISVMERQQDAALSLIDSEVGYNRAVQDVGTALGNFQQVQSDTTSSSAELEGASRGLEDSISRAAASAVQYAQDQATAAGATFTTQDKINAQIGALQALKQKFPELAPAIDAHIGKLNAIPQEKSTKITADTKQADEDLADFVWRVEHTRASVPVDMVPTGTGLTQRDKRAAGGPVVAGGTYVVGEQGPEVFVPNTAGTIIPNGQAGSVTYNQTFTFVQAMSPAEVARAQRTYQRRNAIVKIV